LLYLVTNLSFHGYFNYEHCHYQTLFCIPTEVICSASYYDSLRRAICPNFWVSNVDIQFHGVPGCTIPKYYASVLPILHSRQTSPHIVYVELGHNDICRRQWAPETIARDLVALARKISKIHSVRQAILVEPIWRLKSPCNMPDFHSRIHDFRTEFRPLVDATPSVHRWYHAKLWQKNPNYFVSERYFSEPFSSNCSQLKACFVHLFFQLLQLRVGFTLFLAPDRNVPVNMTTTLDCFKRNMDGFD